MKRILAFALPVLALSLAAPVMAGSGEKCTASTQECLDYMAKNYSHKGWIGVEIDQADGGLTLKAVVPDSPAEQAGLVAGDVLLAVNGVTYAEENHEKLGEIQKSMIPGAEFTFTVKHEGKEKDVAVVLGEMPEDVLAKMIGGHMMEHAAAVAEEE